MACGGAGRGHSGEDVGLAESGKPHLAPGYHVGPNGAPKCTLHEQDERGAHRLRVQNVPVGDSS